MGDEYTTPHDGHYRVPVNSSREARAIANTGIALSSLATDLGEIARRFDGLQGNALAAELDAIDEKLRKLGDMCHEVARSLAGLKTATPANGVSAKR